MSFQFGDDRVLQIGFLAACGIAALIVLAIFYRLAFADRLRVTSSETASRGSGWSTPSASTGSGSWCWSGATMSNVSSADRTTFWSSRRSIARWPRRTEANQASPLLRRARPCGEPKPRSLRQPPLKRRRRSRPRRRLRRQRRPRRRRCASPDRRCAAASPLGDGPTGGAADPEGAPCRPSARCRSRPTYAPVPPRHRRPFPPAGPPLPCAEPIAPNRRGRPPLRRRQRERQSAPDEAPASRRRVRRS